MATTLLRAAPALRSPAFRLFWLGQLISLIGTALQVEAEGWLIYQLTHSTFWLGMVGLIGLLPVLPVSLLGGVLIDRMPRQKLILITQSALLIQALLFALIVLSGRLQLWHMILLYFSFGAILALDHPARRAFLVELVAKEDFANAVALNGAVFNLASLLGYALGGVMIATLGAGYALLFNALTYLAPILALCWIKLPPPTLEQQPKQSFGVAMTEGFKTLWQQPTILGVMTLMAVVGGLTWPVFGLLPAYADQIVHTDAMGLGVLMAAGAFGSVLGTLLVSIVGKGRRGRTLTWMSLCLPALIALFATTHTLSTAAILLITIGAALLIIQSLAITLVQLHIPDRVRGRVMALYSILHAGSDTGGNAVVGWLGMWIGLPLALSVGAGMALLYAFGLRVGLPQVDQLD